MWLSKTIWFINCMRLDRCRANLEQITKSIINPGLGLSRFQFESFHYHWNCSLFTRQRLPRMLMSEPGKANPIASSFDCVQAKGGQLESSKDFCWKPRLESCLDCLIFHMCNTRSTAIYVLFHPWGIGTGCLLSEGKAPIPSTYDGSIRTFVQIWTWVDHVQPKMLVGCREPWATPGESGRRRWPSWKKISDTGVPRS